VAYPHRFLGLNEAGQVAITTTRGNRGAHIVLRGGSKGPNYDAQAIAECEAALLSNNLPNNIMVDCSHANSNKDHRMQVEVGENVSEQILAGNRSITGLMYESNIGEGRQDHSPGVTPAPGISITDACISFAATQNALQKMNDELGAALRARRPARERAA